MLAWAAFEAVSQLAFSSYPAINEPSSDTAYVIAGVRRRKYISGTRSRRHVLQQLARATRPRR